jgi:dGTPase
MTAGDAVRGTGVRHTEPGTRVGRAGTAFPETARLYGPAPSAQVIIRVDGLRGTRDTVPMPAGSTTDPAAVARVRAVLDAREAALDPLAARLSTSAGRARPEPVDPMRVAYQVDRDRIIHTRAFRRLKHKTQVFVAPDSDHVVTRMTHTIEVQQVARTIARALNLNEDLTEAVGLGHDLGHTPFGHAGEERLGELLPDGFRHNEQSLRIVDLLERDGAGLNLTAETREGILKHSKVRESVAAEAWGTAGTLEGQIVKLADSIAYLNHDIQDAIRAGLLAERDLPAEVVTVLGADHSSRINTLVTDCVIASAATFDGREPRIVLGAEVLAATDTLREFMFERVYLHEATLREARRGQEVVAFLFAHYAAHPDQITGWSRAEDPPWRRAADYVSGMTDGFATRRARDLGFAG